jgi:hypothetical protein
LFAEVAFLLVLLGQLVGCGNKLLLQLLNLGNQLPSLLLCLLRYASVLLHQQVEIRLLVILNIAEGIPQPSNF